MSNALLPPNRPDGGAYAHPPDWQTALGTILERLDAISREVGSGHAAKSHYTVGQVAEAVGRSEYRVRAWLKEGRLRGVKLPGVGPRSRWLVPREELARLLGGTPATA